MNKRKGREGTKKVKVVIFFSTIESDSINIGTFWEAGVTVTSSQKSDIANENTLGLYNELLSKNGMQLTAEPAWRLSVEEEEEKDVLVS